MKISSIIILIIILFGCTPKERHFITNEQYRNQVKEQFNQRKALANNRYDKLFQIFVKEEMSIEEREALEFLYAYMPLSDLADYDGYFFLRQVRTALEARSLFPWGKTIPEDIFRHFVLVYRVNNENLDDARQIFFNELQSRVRGLSMAEAALEVNHWCHEMVTYQATDGRTSAPLALRRTSWGRCGEESTFTVTALRAIGIPARQCYTPRWAHTDDNHAWVEVWVDGKWHYMGACEPEPELNMAWFSGPVKRAMMVHTKVFGLYKGTEEKNFESPIYSEINLLQNYTETKKLDVNVINSDNKPAVGAKVQFKIYNYAELYPIATKITDSNGKASLTTGYGDLIVWANIDDKYGYVKIPAKEISATVTLNHNVNDSFEDSFELIPPKEQKVAEVSSESREINNKRLAEEDSLRNAYIATFINEERASRLFDEIGLWNMNLRKELFKYLELSQGNHLEISSFIKKSNFESPYLLPFLASLTEKDLRDTPERILSDHFSSGIKEQFMTNNQQVVDFLAKYVLSPRIERELIQPWRTFFVGEFSKLGISNIGISDIIYLIKENITICDENYFNCPITPRGVYELGYSDIRSRNILFVALCRAAAIPARLDPATEIPQYSEHEIWKDVIFDEEVEQASKAVITFNDSKQNIIKPQYSIHYTVANFENGDFNTLDYEDDEALKKLPASITSNPGYFRFIVGNRANDGSVIVNSSFFTMNNNDRKNFTVELPEIQGKMMVMGIVDMNSRVDKIDLNHTTLKELSNDKGVVLCFIDPGKEPSKQVLQNLPTYIKELESWNGAVIFVIPEDKLSVGFDTEVFKGLPSQTVWAVDFNRNLLKTISNTMLLNFSENFPLMLFLNNNGGILYYSEGYRTGIGENIIKTIKENEATMK